MEIAVPSWFAKTPIGQKLIAESETLALGVRRKAAAEITRLRARLESEIPPLTKAVANVAEKVRLAETSLRAAQDAHQAAVLAERSARTSIESAIAGLEGQLSATASSLIDAFRAELLDLYAATRSTAPGRAITAVHRNLVTGSRTGTLETTARSLAGRLAVIVQLLRDLDGLKLEPLTEQEVSARISAMRDSIPEAAAEEIDVRLPA